MIVEGCPARPVVRVEERGRWFWRREVEVHEPHCFHRQVESHSGLWYTIWRTCCQCGGSREGRPIFDTVDVQRIAGVPWNELDLGVRKRWADIPGECRYD